ncbi:hypothetical protein RHGRI_030544 [Rhododendron griersonianum]|uniref:Uncharacterized protein n=1 Tax=Rhododendron griersonianum TaxID=479676 RepID=A0AAV6INF5_9ERIC|nr:hypothetical protein RHGRI_030544 [Rhododendron griersonianum]
MDKREFAIAGTTSYFLSKDLSLFIVSSPRVVLLGGGDPAAPLPSRRPLPPKSFPPSVWRRGFWISFLPPSGAVAVRLEHRPSSSLPLVARVVWCLLQRPQPVLWWFWWQPFPLASDRLVISKVCGGLGVCFCFLLLLVSPASPDLSPAGFPGSDLYRPGFLGPMGAVGGLIRLGVVFSVCLVFDAEVGSGSCVVGGCVDSGGLTEVLVANDFVQDSPLSVFAFPWFSRNYKSVPFAAGEFLWNSVARFAA